MVVGPNAPFRIAVFQDSFLQTLGVWQLSALWGIVIIDMTIGYPCDVKSEKAMAPHSSTLAWKIPWMEEPGRLQSMGSLRVRHD